MNNVIKIPKVRAAPINDCAAFKGYAIGLRLLGDIECIVIAATRDEAQRALDAIDAEPGDAAFACPVAMMQLKDVEVIAPA